MTRESDIQKCRNIIKQFLGANFRKFIRIMNEKKVMQRKDLFTYRYQMGLKLAIAKHVKTKWYMTLDSDLYLTKKIGYGELIDEEGRAHINYEPTSCHAGWWKNASKVIKTKVEGRGMGVTPSILNRDVVLKLIKKHNIHDALNQVATEYTLYWLYLIANYDKNEYYCIGERPVYSMCVWTNKQFSKRSLEEHIKAQFNSENTMFTLIQSTCNVNSQKLISLVNKYSDIEKNKQYE